MSKDEMLEIIADLSASLKAALVPEVTISTDSQPLLLRRAEDVLASTDSSPEAFIALEFRRLAESMGLQVSIGDAHGVQARVQSPGGVIVATVDCSQHKDGQWRPGSDNVPLLMAQLAAHIECWRRNGEVKTS